MNDADFNKLRWRCRRGMRELDQVFDYYLNQHFLTASPEQQAAFAALTNAPDPDIYAWIAGREPSPPGATSDIIQIFRQHKQ